MRSLTVAATDCFFIFLFLIWYERAFCFLFPVCLSPFLSRVAIPTPLLVYVLLLLVVYSLSQPFLFCWCVGAFSSPVCVCSASPALCDFFFSLCTLFSLSPLFMLVSSVPAETYWTCSFVFYSSNSLGVHLLSFPFVCVRCFCDLLSIFLLIPLIVVRPSVRRRHFLFFWLGFCGSYFV